MVSQFKLETVSEKIAHLEGLEKIPSINPRSYDEREEYSRMDYVDHKEFGVGFVEEVVDQTSIRVFFPCGEKVLSQKTYK